MNETAMMYSELGFNVLYLAFIWWIVIKMFLNQNSVLREDKRIARYFYYAFLLLAIGDTGHVGFRVIAYAMGGLESTVNILGYNLPLVGAGALSTAITITVFYMFIVAIWKLRFKEKTVGPYLSFQVIAVARLVLMCFPQNEWANVVPPEEWSIYRNIPLMIVGLGVASHLLLSNRKEKDRFYRNLALLIFASYLFYMPVVFYIQEIPMLGMLMIPKTIAYVLMAYMAYRKFFNLKKTKQ